MKILRGAKIWKQKIRRERNTNYGNIFSVFSKYDAKNYLICLYKTPIPNGRLPNLNTIFPEIFLKFSESSRNNPWIAWKFPESSQKIPYEKNAACESKNVWWFIHSKKFIPVPVNQTVN